MVEGTLTRKDAKFVEDIRERLKRRTQQRFNLRSYQKPLWDAVLNKGKKESYALWHRGAGKDFTCLNIVIEAMKRKVGFYPYFFPTYEQGKEILWNGIDNNGNRFLSYFPEHLRIRTIQDEMRIEFKNGSIFRIMGTGDLESVNKKRGLNIDGAVMSELAWHRSDIWDNVLRPSVQKKDGWVIFNTTPWGKNHAKRMYDNASGSEDWFCQKLTIDDTKKDGLGEDGSPVVLQTYIDKLRRDGTPEETIRREYYCSF